MATFNQGVHGGFSGRVGNVVGSTWKGKKVMKIRPASVRNPRTPRQLEVRQRFRLMGRFLSSQNRLVRLGWKAAAIEVTSFNEAMRQNIAEAITGEYPELAIDFSMVKLSVGKLPGLFNVQVSSTAFNTVSVSWQNNSGQPLAADSDLLMVGVYDPVSGEGYQSIGAFARQQGAAEIVLPDNWTGRTVEIFLFMVSTLGIGMLSNNEYISPTHYTGSLTLMD